MKQRYDILRWFYLAAVVLLLGQSPAQAQSKNEIIDRLKAKYNEIDALRADFTQTMSSAYSEGKETFSGTLVLQGDKYRVETGRQTLVTDGAVTWIYNADENQVLINNTVDDEANFSVNDFIFNFDKKYDVKSVSSARLAGQRHYRIRLAPKDQEAFYRNVTLWVRASDTVITRLLVQDVNETKMLFALNRIELNPKVDGSTFRFDPPKNAEVVDLRS